jgi:hypothetical protein
MASSSLQLSAGIQISPDIQISSDVQARSPVLLDLPFELREKIIIHAIILPDGVYPRQQENAPKSFSYTYANRHDGRQYAKEEPPTAIQLGSTCRQLFKEVIETNFFYVHNEFRFMDPVFAHTYLRTITPARVMCIQSIYLEIDFIYNPTQAINLISTCKGLKHLRLFFDFPTFDHDHVGWESYLRIRGLESFAVMKIPRGHWNESGRAGSPRNISLQVEAEDRGWTHGISYMKREAMRPRTEEDDRNAEEAVTNDCYCPQSILMHTHEEAVGCDCKDPEFLLAAQIDREYTGDGTFGNRYMRSVDLETDFPEEDLPRPRWVASSSVLPAGEANQVDSKWVGYYLD